MTIGQRIRKLREARRLSQAGLASVLDVDRSTVTYWEREESEGKQPHTPRDLARVAEFFGVSLASFYRGAGKS